MAVIRTGAALLALAGASCGSKPPPAPRHDAGDAGPTAATIDAGAVLAIPAGPTPAGATAPYRLAAIGADGGLPGGGGLRVTVTWPTAPTAVRASPGYTTCHTPRPPRVRVGTLHGVAGALVVIDDVAAGVAPRAAEDVRVMIHDCAITPPVVLAPRLGVALEVQSQDDRDQAVTIERLGPAWRAPTAATPARVARTHLPIRGHVVTVPLAEPGVWRVTVEGLADPAHVIVGPHPYVGLTDDVGQLALPSLLPGAYPVTAWLPATAEHPAARATGTATITAGATTELTLTF